MIVMSPSLVQNNEFVYVIDDFYHQKFNICAIRNQQISGEKLQNLFKELVPRVHNIETLENEFKRGDSVVIVVEKPKAYEESDNLIGKFGIKVASDYLKKK